MRGSLVYPNNQKLYILQRFHDFRRFVNSHPDTEQLDIFDDFQCSEFCKKKLFERITHSWRFTEFTDAPSFTFVDIVIRISNEEHFYFMEELNCNF